MVDKGLFSESAWFFAMGASEFVSAPLSELETVDESRLLELRVFDGNREIKVVRGSLSGGFQTRDSTSIKYGKSRRELYFLDIDSTKEANEPGFVRATGGGKYRLPTPRPEKIEVEHFYIADEKGFYTPVDFRVVGFVQRQIKV